MLLRIALLGIASLCVSSCATPPAPTAFKAYEGTELPRADLAVINTVRACAGDDVVHYCEHGAVSEVESDGVRYYSYVRDRSVFRGVFELAPIDILLRPGTYAVTYQASPSPGYGDPKQRTDVINLLAGHTYRAQRQAFNGISGDVHYFWIRDVTTGEIVAGRAKK